MATEDGDKLKHREASNFVTAKPDGVVMAGGLPPDGSICLSFYLESLELKRETIRDVEGQPGAFRVAPEDGDTAPLREDMVRLILRPDLAIQLHGLLDSYIKEVTSNG